MKDQICRCVVNLPLISLIVEVKCVVDLKHLCRHRKG